MLDFPALGSDDRRRREDDPGHPGGGWRPTTTRRPDSARPCLFSPPQRPSCLDAAPSGGEPTDFVAQLSRRGLSVVASDTFAVRAPLPRPFASALAPHARARIWRPRSIYLPQRCANREEVRRLCSDVARRRRIDPGRRVHSPDADVGATLAVVSRWRPTYFHLMVAAICSHYAHAQTDKRNVHDQKPSSRRYTVWDAEVEGFDFATSRAARACTFS
jgi:hypothetical protein